MVAKSHHTAWGARIYAGHLTFQKSVWSKSLVVPPKMGKIRSNILTVNGNIRPATLDYLRKSEIIIYKSHYLHKVRNMASFYLYIIDSEYQ